jgi:hypothetical protein
LWHRNQKRQLIWDEGSNRECVAEYARILNLKTPIFLLQTSGTIFFWLLEWVVKA